MTNREKQILELLKMNALIQQQELAETLGISRSTVAGHIIRLINKGYIEGRGYILAENHYHKVTINKAGTPLCHCLYTPNNSGCL
jgi:pseudouridine kinase